MVAFLRRVLSPRNLGVLIGVTAICVAIAAFGGELVLFGVRPFAGLWQRLWGILVVLTIWLAAEGFVWWRGRRADARVLKLAVDCARDESKAATDAELAEHNAHLRDMIDTLRRERAGYGRQFVLALPWYLVVGPVAAGKTTLVMESGLQMLFEEPLADPLGQSARSAQQQALRWRWVFTNEAVFICGAGALVQDAGQDSATLRNWRNLLDFVQRQRPRRPLDGVIVVIPAGTLLAGGGREIATTIRRRLQEAMLRLAVRLQAYLVISQCDVILGFAEFFGRLDVDALAQPFGVALPAQGGVIRGGQNSLQDRLAQLVGSVSRLLPSRTAIEPNPSIRARMALFPEQLAAVSQSVLEFAGELTLVGRAERPLLLRGAFLTSAGRTGETMAAEIDGWSGRFGLGVGLMPTLLHDLREGRLAPLFLKGLFQRFIVPEAGLAGRSMRAERRTAMMNGAGYLGCLSLLVVAAGWWSAEYTSHVASLQAMRGGVAAERAVLPAALPQNGLAAVLPALDRAWSLTRIDLMDTPTESVIGISPLGIAAAGEATQRNYDSALQTLLLPALLTGLQQQLQQATSTGVNRSRIRSLLTIYLMFADPSHYNKPSVAAWTGNVVQGEFPFDPQRRASAQKHVTRLLELMPLPVSLDQGLIAEARADLRQQPNVDAVYERLKALSLNSPNAQPLDVESALGAAGSQLLMLRTQAGLPVVVPALYTRNGFYQIFLPQAPLLARGIDADDWVLGGTGSAADQSVASVLQAVTNQYVQQYVRQWQGVIGQIGLRALPDLPSLAGGLQTMAGPDSPLVQLINLIKQQTELDPPTTPQTGLLAQAAGAVSGVAGGSVAAGGVAAGGVGSATAANLAQQAANLAVPPVFPTDPKIWPGNAIRLPFAPLQTMLDTKSGQAPLQRVTNTLAASYGVVSGVASAQSPEGAAQQIAAQVMSGQGADPLVGLRVQAATLPRPLDGIFRQIYASIWNTFMRLTLDRIEASWARDVAPICEQAIARRYPFIAPGDPSVGRDVAVRDFSSFFGPNGIMDKFIAGNLMMFTTQGPDGRLALASQNGLALDLSGSDLSEISRARDIRNLFFGPEGNLLVRFWLTPSYLDPRAMSATLQIDQTKLVYRHEPPQPAPFSWPPTGDGGATFSITTVNGEVHQTHYDGTWAVFQLLQGATSAKDGNGARLTVSFDLNGYKANYQLRAESVSNPFVDRAFSAFRCVPRL